MMRRTTWMALGLLLLAAMPSGTKQPALPEMTIHYVGMLKAEVTT